MMDTRAIRAVLDSEDWRGPLSAGIHEIVTTLADELDARNGEIRTLKARIAALESGTQTRGSFAALSELARVYGEED